MSLKGQQPKLLCNPTSVYMTLGKFLYLTFPFSSMGDYFVTAHGQCENWSVPA